MIYADTGKECGLVLSLRKVTKRFGQKTAVDSVYLDIPPGERFCLLGHNGAGKTTLLRLISGLTRPSEGTIHVAGEDPAREPRVRRRLGYLPDEPYLYDKLTGDEHLRLHAALYTLSPDEVRHRGAQLINDLGLEDDARHRAETLSFGTRKKLALVLALVHEPDLLILDEPLDGLDPASATKVGGLLRRHAAKGGAVVLSTHSPQFVASFASRVGFMREGRLVSQGIREEVGQG